MNLWSWSRAPCRWEKEEQKAKLVLHGESLPKALAKNFDQERKELTKPCEQGREARLPLSLPAAEAGFHLAPRYSSFHAGQQFLVRDLVTLQDSSVLGLPLCVIKSH